MTLWMLDCESGHLLSFKSKSGMIPRYDRTLELRRDRSLLRPEQPARVDVGIRSGFGFSDDVQTPDSGECDKPENARRDVPVRQWRREEGCDSLGETDEEYRATGSEDEPTLAEDHGPDEDGDKKVAEPRRMNPARKIEDVERECNDDSGEQAESELVSFLGATTKHGDTHS